MKAIKFLLFVAALSAALTVTVRLAMSCDPIALVAERIQDIAEGGR